MPSYFHLLDNEVFSARMPGKAPTETERKEFRSPKLKAGMRERDIRLQLGVVIRSILKAAKCKKLSVSLAEDLETSDDKRRIADTLGGSGIYCDPPLAHQASDAVSDSCEKSKGKMKKFSPSARSCFWMEVPIVVKSEEGDSAFYFRPQLNTLGSRDDGRPGETEIYEDGCEEDVGDASEEGRQDNDRKGSDEYEDDDEDEDSDDTDADEESSEDDVDSSDEVQEHDDFESDGKDLEASEETGHSASDHDSNFLKKSFPPFINLDNGLKALDQFLEHPLNVFKHQHRTFCYSIYVCFDMARLVYFDRAGVLVSEPFSWVEPTSLLHEFVWKLAKLAKAKRLGDMGHDTTAKVVSLAQRRKFVSEAQNPALAAHIRAGLKKAAASDCPLYELTVEEVPPSPDEWFPDEPFPCPSSSHSSPSGNSCSDDSKSQTDVAHGFARSTHCFIVGRPHFSSDALIGSCTKGYMAFDVTDPENWVPCFVKDSWRPYIRGRTRPEHLVYERFRRMNVKPTDGIATLICGGDVGGSYAQYTRIQEDVPGEDRPVRRIHYRLVVEDIGLPLTDFYNFGDLSGTLADALRTHYKAFKRAKVLHHADIVGNIMIRVDGARRIGFLIDWELSRVECELSNGNDPVKPDRAGTWQFRSALSLQYPKKPYRRSDDIESFIHVFLYLVLRYHHTYLHGPKDLARGLFDQASLIGGVRVGGDAKLAAIRAGKVPFHVRSNKPLQNLLSALIEGCARAYSKLDRRAMDRLYGPDWSFAPRPSKPLESTSGIARPARVRIRQISSLDMTEASDDEDLEKALNLVHASSSWEDHAVHQASPTATPTATTVATSVDLCKAGGFLSSPRALIDLFCDHSAAAIRLKDKAYDLFSESEGFIVRKRARSRSTSEDEVEEEEGSSSRSPAKRLRIIEKGKVART